MIRYILITKKLVGYILFEYLKNGGYMVKFENCTYGMTDDQQAYLLRELRYCLTLGGVAQWANDNGHELILLQEDLSFERFWEAYDHQKNKLGAQKYWAKLSDADKRFALQNIVAYRHYIAVNAEWYNKKYPDGYLGAEKLYMDEWFKLLKKGKK